MAIQTPQPRIGAEFPLGFVEQDDFDTPVAVPAAIGNWINQTSNTLVYRTGEHMIHTALGTRAVDQESAQGETALSGGFGANLRTSTSRKLLERYFGVSTDNMDGTTTISVSRPKLMTIYDNWAGEQHQYQNCMLDQMTLQCQNHLEWSMAYTVWGGLETLVDSAMPTFAPVLDRTFAWADVTGLDGFVVDPGQISQFSMVFNNGVKPFWGAGQHAATAVLGGAFTITGSFIVRFDNANASEFEQDYIVGQDMGPATLTLQDPTNPDNTIIVSIPNITLTGSELQKPLDDWQTLNVTYGVKQAQLFSITMPSTP